MVHISEDFFTYAIAAHAVAAFTMAFVPSKDIGHRVVMVITIASLCFRAISATDRITVDGQSYAEYMFGFILHANCFLVLLGLAASRSGKTPWERWKWATVALFTPRRKLPQRSRRWEGPIQNRWLFAGLRILKAGILGAAYEYLYTRSLLPIILEPADVTPDKDSMLVQIFHQTLTRRELQLRADMAFSSIAMPALVLSRTHSAFSALAVGLFDSDPAGWPPLFGNIFDAWSMERWYSCFWTKLMRKAFTINARFLAERVVGLKPGSPLGRSCIVMLSFALSGLMHTISGWTPGPCASWRPMAAYLATGVVVLAERGVQTMYARVVHSRRGWGWKWTRWEVWGWRLVGYCWVMVFWMEALPSMIKPGIRCHEQQA